MSTWALGVEEWVFGPVVRYEGPCKKPSAYHHPTPKTDSGVVADIPEIVNY